MCDISAIVTALVTLEGATDGPNFVPQLAGISLKPNLGPWAKQSAGKKLQRQGQLVAAAGMLTGNDALTALGAGRYLQGKAKVKSANRSIRTISDVGKAAVVIGGTIATAGALGAFGGGATAVGGAAGIGGAGASGIGGSLGAGAIASGVTAPSLMSTIGSGLATVGNTIASAAPTVAAIAAPVAGALLTQSASQAGIDASPVADSIITGNYSDIPNQVYDIAQNTAFDALDSYLSSQVQPGFPSSFNQGGIGYDQATIVVDPATQDVTLERAVDIEPEPKTNIALLLGAGAIAFLFLNQKKGRKK